MTDRVRLPLLDVMVCTTCELRCVACTNHVGGFDHLRIFPADEVTHDIDLAAGVIHAEVAVLLGGEPLQHPRIVDLMRHTRESGLADRVRVLTNGIRLHKMTPAFWEELQDLKISIYPDVTPPENVELAKAMQARHGFALSFYDIADDSFRAVLTREPRDDESAQRVYETCWYRTFTRKVEQGFFFRCCTSPAISKTVLGLDPGHDGIALDGLTVEALEAFLARSSFMESCRRCHGNMGPKVEWRQERDRARWLDASMVAA